MARASKNLRRAVSGLSWTDKLLPLLIILAMVVGILLSVYVTEARNAFSGTKFLNVSIPLLVGLVVMMVPPLCKVEWELLHQTSLARSKLEAIGLSLVLNWIVCPFLMFGLAWLTLFDKPEYRVGIIMIGLARCIAMVLLWNQIAGGDNNLCAILVVINSVLQVVLYAPYQLFFCYTITGGHSNAVNQGSAYSTVAKTVAFFLGVPMLIGMLIRALGISLLGKNRYDSQIVPIISPWALIGLLYTIVVIFIEKGDDFIKDIGSGFRCFVPLIAYFLIAWFGTFFLVRYYFGKANKRIRLQDSNSNSCGCEKACAGKPDRASQFCDANYSEVVTHTFVASSNNFELSLAVAISLYGSGSKEAIAATFGPLLEVPILLLLAFVAKFFKEKLLWNDSDAWAELDEESEGSNRIAVANN